MRPPFVKKKVPPDIPELAAWAKTRKQSTAAAKENPEERKNIQEHLNSRIALKRNYAYPYFLRFPVRNQTVTHRAKNSARTTESQMPSSFRKTGKIKTEAI